MHPRRRFAVPVLAALVAAVLVVTAAPAGAQTAPTLVLGRRTVYYQHFGNPALGQVLASAQGQVLDTNGNGLYDSLQARGAMLEIRKVRRLVIYSVVLQVNIGGVWRNAAVNPTDVIAPSYVKSTTAPVRLCPFPKPDRTYRAVHNDGIRWDDGRLGVRTTVSNPFTWRMLVNDPDCDPPVPPPPPPTTSTTTTLPAPTTTSTTLPPPADLTVTKDLSDPGDPGVQAPDDDFTYVVVVGNTGAAAASTTVVDSWPVGLDDPADANPAVAGVQVDADAATAGFQDRGCVYDPTARTITCSLGLVTGPVTLRFAARTNGAAAGTLTNTVAVATATREVDIDDNIATLALPVNA
jgi:hypothetical protein